MVGHCAALWHNTVLVHRGMILWWCIVAVQYRGGTVSWRYVTVVQRRFMLESEKQGLQQLVSVLYNVPDEQVHMPPPADSIAEAHLP